MAKKPKVTGREMANLIRGGVNPLSLLTGSQIASPQSNYNPMRPTPMRTPAPKGKGKQ